MSETREYRIDPALRVMAVIAGLIGLGVAVYLLHIWLSEEEPKSVGWGLLVGVEAFCLGAAGSLFWLASRADVYAVAADASGIRSLDPRRPHLHVPWGAISGVRARPFMQRLDLLTLTDTSLMRLEYQLADFDRLLATLVREAPQLGTARPLPAAFGRRPPVEVNEQEVLIRRRRARRIPLAEISRPLLHLHEISKRRFDLRVRLSLHSREVVTLPTGGSETFDLYRTLERALADTRTTG